MPLANVYTCFFLQLLSNEHLCYLCSCFYMSCVWTCIFVKSKQYTFFWFAFVTHCCLEKLAQGCEIGSIPTWEKINYKLQTCKDFCNHERAE